MTTEPTGPTDSTAPGMAAAREVSRRRFFTVSSAAAATAFLAACGSNTGRNQTSAANTSAASTSAAATDTAGASSSAGSSAAASSSGAGSSAGSSAGASGTGSGTVELSQWYHQYGEKGTQQAVERYAAAYPNATVTVQWVPGDYDSKVAAALLTDDGPDVFEAGNGPSIDAIQGGQVVPLDGILGDAASDFPESLINRMSWDGHLYAVPQVIDMQLMVYRKSMLQAAGIQPPTSFNELTAAAKALTTDDVKGLFVGNDGGVGVLVGPTLWSVGADYLTEDNKVGFADPAVAEAFASLHTLFTSGNLLLGAPTDWSDPSAFSQGLCAMQWTGLWTLPQVIKDLGDDFGIIPWPQFLTGGKGGPSVPIGAYGSTVSARSKNPDAAKSYVKWLWVDNTDAQLDFAQSYGFHLPSRNSVAAKASALTSGAALDALKSMQQYGHAQTPLLWTPACSTAMSDAVTRIIKDGADAAKELAAVVKTTESELARVQK